MQTQAETSYEGMLGRHMGKGARVKREKRKPQSQVNTFLGLNLNVC